MDDTKALDVGGWYASARVLHGTRICTAVFLIECDGDVRMTGDIDLVSNLTVRRNAFEGPIRYELALYKLTREPTIRFT